MTTAKPIADPTRHRHMMTHHEIRTALREAHRAHDLAAIEAGNIPRWQFWRRRDRVLLRQLLAGAEADCWRRALYGHQVKIETTDKGAK